MLATCPRPCGVPFNGVLNLAASWSQTLLPFPLTIFTLPHSSPPPLPLDFPQGRHPRLWQGIPDYGKASH